VHGQQKQKTLKYGKLQITLEIHFLIMQNVIEFFHHSLSCTLNAVITETEVASLPFDCCFENTTQFNDRYRHPTPTLNAKM